MRFLLSHDHYQEMRSRADHTPDCYVRPGQYLHHLYMDGVKYVVAPALAECLVQAQERNDEDAVRHLQLHQSQYDLLATRVLHEGGNLDELTALGDPPPPLEETPAPRRHTGYVPISPKDASETGLSNAFLYEMILRTIYNRGRLTGSQLAGDMKLGYGVLDPLLPAMRKQGLIDIVGQRGSGDANYEYEIKPPKGNLALQDALAKTSYSGPCPVPFDDYVESVAAQTIRNLCVTRRSIQKAFQDLIITPEVFNEIGPAVNSAASIFLFGYPGNGKTSLAERITRLMGDDIYIPFAVEANGSIIKLYDPIVHQAVEAAPDDGMSSVYFKKATGDERYLRIKRPTIVTGGELNLPMLDLKYNPIGKFYEAPLQMKANGGIFMIDDFGRQQVRAKDLLNRWIVPLENRYDYLSTVTGNKFEVPFEQLLDLLDQPRPEATGRRRIPAAD